MAEHKVLIVTSGPTAIGGHFYIDEKEVHVSKVESIVDVGDISHVTFTLPVRSDNLTIRRSYTDDEDYARLAATGDVNEERYHHDPVYHAVAYRIRHGKPDATEQ